MILKMKLEKSWAYHETEEVRIEEGMHKTEDIEGALVYSGKDDIAHLLYYKNKAGKWQGILYRAGYLLNNAGDTINSL